MPSSMCMIERENVCVFMCLYMINAIIIIIIIKLWGRKRLTKKVDLYHKHMPLAAMNLP